MAKDTALDARSLTSGRLVARNAVWNLAGRCLPAVVAVLTIPPLLHALGPDRFGILTLALTFVGYFGLLDFGLGRAMTQVISERIGQGREGDVPTVIWTGFAILFAVSVLGIVLSAALVPVVIRDVLKVPSQIEGETIAAFYVLALSIPFVIGNGALWGVLAAHQRFDLSNRVSMPLGVATYVGPLLVLKWSNSLVAVMAVLLTIRALGCLCLSGMCLHVAPGLRQRSRFDLQAARRLITFGGWLSLSSLITPLMTSMDRFIIGALVSITAVAYYGTAYDIVTKLWIFPVAVLSVLAPAMATSIASGSKNAGALFARALLGLFAVLFSASFLIDVFAREGVGLWLGPDFAAHSARIFQWLAAGVFVNSLTQAPIVAMGARGRPDITAKLQMLEFPIFCPLMYGAIVLYGLEGAAIAWTVRALTEALIVFLLAARVVPETRPAINRMLAALPAVLVAFGLGGLFDALGWKMVFAAIVELLLWSSIWQFALSAADRNIVLNYVRRMPKALGVRA